jgi:hypothetical protein
VRRRTIEVIRYQRITFVHESTSDPVDSTLAHSVLEHLAGESEPPAGLVPQVITSKPPVHNPPRDSSGNWLIKRLLRSIATFRNNWNLK